jgi:hypothetical protein
MKHGHPAVVLASGLPLLKKNPFTRQLQTIARALETRGWKSDIAGRDPEVSGKRRVEKQIKKGMGATWMQADYPMDFTFMHTFTYEDLPNIEPVVETAVQRAEVKVEERKHYFNNLYRWRK